MRRACLLRELFLYGPDGSHFHTLAFTCPPFCLSGCSHRPSAMIKVRGLFEKSGLTLHDLGLKMVYQTEIADL